MASSIQVQLRDETLEFTFDAKINGYAFGVDDAVLISQALKENQAANLLIFRSTSRRFFCTGGDLQHYSQMKSRGEGLRANRRIRYALQMLAEFRGVSLALVDGDAWGGGLELLSCFDEVWSTPQALFGFWQRRIGLSYGWGGRARLEERVSSAHLRRLALKGQTISAYEALDLGLVDRILPREIFEVEITKWRANHENLGIKVTAALKAETHRADRQFEGLWLKKDHREALAKFSRAHARTRKS